MQTNRTDITALSRLATSKGMIPVDSIPASFIPEFNHFFFGKTLVKKEGKLFAFPHDIKNWVKTVFKHYNG